MSTKAELEQLLERYRAIIVALEAEAANCTCLCHRRMP